MNVFARAIFGGLAGCAGTAALNALTYADMAVRGRPASEIPERVVRTIAESADWKSLAGPRESLSDAGKNRRSGIAALLGYADGIGAGVAFGVLRPALKDVSPLWLGVLLAGFTMVASEGTATALRQTDPAEWPLSAWMSDVVPRCAYGWITQFAFDRFAAA